jgi:histidinol-phosphate aminotransferase
MTKHARKDISKIEPYVPGRSIEEVEKEYGKKRWVKLASNENLLGPSPKALKAIMKEASKIYLYPEGLCTDLRRAIAEKLSMPEETLVLSNGADNLILMIANAFVDPGDEVIMADPTFTIYSNVVHLMGGKPVRVRLKDYDHDLPGMLKRANRKTKLVFICSPNNPTGTIVRKKDLDPFLNKLPKQALLILDEAYGDFVEDRDYPDSLRYVKEGRPLILLRTFSKLYGLAGLRIGFSVGRRDLVDSLYQVREPFPVNRLAQVGALAALSDTDHAARSFQLVSEGRTYLYGELKKMSLFYVPSQANFILIDFGRDSDEVFKALLGEGIIIRPGKTWGYPTCARVTVGRMEDNRRFIKALRKIMR